MASGSNITSGFIDLATFDEIEKYQYGSNQAFAYFVRETRKSTWFTQVPVLLSRSTGSPDFGQTWSVNISRAGDYLLHVWLRLTLPQIEVLPGNAFGNIATSQGALSWCKNFMHNLVESCTITFNDLIAEQFDTYFLDFWSAFTVVQSKRFGYDNMIGNFDDLVNPHIAGDPIPSRTLNLPLPFFFTRDSGVALPTAALPYNDMKINFQFRNWQDLLILSQTVPPTTITPTANVAADFFRVPIVPTDIAAAPVITNVQVWANYAICSNEERKRMACSPRDILIEQTQSAPRQTFAPATAPNPRYDIRFSHAIKALFFGVRNTSFQNIRSNYTSASPVGGPQVINYQTGLDDDPIITTSLVYENTNRLAEMGSDYFSLVNPFYHAPAIYTETGYHLYSYSLNFYELDPLGSTNFGKLTNVSFAPSASASAIIGANGTGAARSGVSFPQTYEFFVIGVNNNIIRISGGALGFPVL